MTTRAEHHAASSGANVRHAKQQLAWILDRRDCREWAISSGGLAAATGYHDDGPGGISPSTVRDCIKELRQERELPIVSCSRGYYLIDSVAELEREVDRIQAEINTRKETKQELVAAFNARKYE